ncbi:DUF6230 family protein [Actinosynnema sp. NPDC051121]
MSAATAAATVGLLTGVAHGLVGVSFSGAAPIDVVAERVESEGMVIVPALSSDGTASLMVRLPSARLEGLCQSSSFELPVLGTMNTVLRAKQVRATDLTLEARDVLGTLSLEQLVVGALPAEDGERTGYRSDRMSLENVTIRANSVTSATFVVDGLELGHRSEGCPTQGGVATR